MAPPAVAACRGDEEADVKKEAEGRRQAEDGRCACPRKQNGPECRNKSRPETEDQEGYEGLHRGRVLAHANGA